MARIKTKNDHLPTGDFDDDQVDGSVSHLFKTDADYQKFSQQIDQMLGIPPEEDDDDDE